jgi:hypothetical protein
MHPEGLDRFLDIPVSKFEIIRIAITARESIDQTFRPFAF